MLTGTPPPQQKNAQKQIQTPLPIVPMSLITISYARRPCICMLFGRQEVAAPTIRLAPQYFSCPISFREGRRGRLAATLRMNGVHVFA